MLEKLTYEDYLKLDFDDSQTNKAKKLLKKADSMELFEILEVFNRQKHEYIFKMKLITEELESRFPGIKKEIEEKLEK